MYVFTVLYSSKISKFQNFKISLLPISGKISGRVLYKPLFESLMEKNLILPNQSGFSTDDSGTNQLLSVTSENYRSFDDG